MHQALAEAGFLKRTFSFDSFCLPFFTDAVFPPGYVMPTFTRRRNPRSHLVTFRYSIELRGEDPILIRLFPRSRADSAAECFPSCPPRLFTSFDDLGKAYNSWDRNRKKPNIQQPLSSED